MITRYNLLIWLLMLGSMAVHAQSNTAVTSGSVGKCSVWGYPYTLYNNAGATQTVSAGVAVTVDQNRNIGAVDLSGSGALDFSGTNGITMSGSGGDTTCRWDIGGYGNQTVTNNNGVFTNNSVGSSSISLDTGIFFTAPYAGTYRWVMGSGWSAVMGGAFYNGGFGVRKQGNDRYGNIFYQNQANPSGSCGTPAGAQAGPTWTSTLTPITLTAGQGISYAASTIYRSSGPCNDSQLNFTIGTASVFFEN